MKVLIVDDEVYAVNALINRVDWAGYGFDKPLSAHSMAQAQSVFLAVPVDLLLCDIEMPQGSGLDLFEWVKSYYPKTECTWADVPWFSERRNPRYTSGRSSQSLSGLCPIRPCC